MDKLKDKCGVFGVFGHKEAVYLTYLGIYALQHRGEESAGIVATDGRRMSSHRGMGHVQDVFDGNMLDKLVGDRAIGHVRYSTTGSSNLKNAQPILVDYSRGEIAIAHNGNLVNADILRSELEAYGSIFQTTTDSEIIIHLMAKPSNRNIEEGVVDALSRVRGAYSLVFLTNNTLIAARDPQGFRPLWLGKLGGAWVVSSETCAFDIMDAQPVREIEPGEVVFITDKGIRSGKIVNDDLFSKGDQRAHCIFEHVYFARPDSKIFGDSVHLVRERFGRQLAIEQPAEADIVIPVPDSGNSAALGFSQQSGIPLEAGIIRNHYVGRTFIQPTQGIRDFKVRVKFNLVKEVLKGKRVVVVDDSIVRGTTSKMRVKSLRQAGAKEVHLRISCPPHKYACAYGIDFPTREELIANRYTKEEMLKYFDCDSLGYLSLEGMLSCVSFPKENYCTACWSGAYPVPFEGLDKYCNEKTENAKLGSGEKITHANKT
ncbi:MAG TPA: amidophosphoribosyltransferase [Candidatus Eisenbacteria bacterium]|jgi:amidophosphoribosyltransferase|nr:amidophosphoribosyltransferase [Candidatus Eisenbacteria bacterium]